MRKPDQITIDRLLLLHLLQTAEPFGLLNDVKLQQLTFLCELQMFAKGLKGFHFEFFRYAYGAFSKDLDNDLMSMRRKERVENFSASREAEDIIELFLEESEKTKSETNAQVLDILNARGLLPDTVFVERCGTPEERIVRDLVSLRGQRVSYFSLLLVRNHQR